MRQGHTLKELIFWHIYDCRQCPRRELGGRFGLSGATISRAITLLFKEELIAEKPSGNARPGRRPQILQVNPEPANFVGPEIDLDGWSRR
ncbi:MAG: hypothetical protein NZ554_07470 [Bryobacteraceae bacterium]|nr:hypothetical protein [Bryobacteraceae bacterium]